MREAREPRRGPPAEAEGAHPFKWESSTKWTPAGILAGDPHPLASVIT
jgi:hypothetical protein